MQTIFERTLLLALMLGFFGCSSGGEDPGPQGGQAGGQGGSSGRGGSGGSGGSRAGGSGGSGGSAGSTGTGGTAGTGTGGAGGAGGSGSGGSGGATGGTGGAGGSGTGGSVGTDGRAGDAGPGDTAADMAGDTTSAGPDGPAPDRPMGGAACATGGNYNFTIRPFGSSQTGMFTAWFTVTPSRAPTNSVIGLSDGQKYLHDDYAVIVRFGTSGMLDVRNGAAYTSMTPIQYKVTDYHFRLVVNVPAKTYSAYVSFEGMPEVTLGTNLMYRDSAGTVNQFSHWGVEAVAGSNTKVCGFLVQ